MNYRGGDWVVLVFFFFFTAVRLVLLVGGFRVLDRFIVPRYDRHGVAVSIGVALFDQNVLDWPTFPTFLIGRGPQPIFFFSNTIFVFFCDIIPSVGCGKQNH